VLAGLISSKLLLHPLLGLVSILAALRAGLLPGDTDPLMVLVMLLVWATPTAVLTHSLATMLQVRACACLWNPRVGLCWTVQDSYACRMHATAQKLQCFSIYHRTTRRDLLIPHKDLTVLATSA
jgi:hypothetical protein